MNHDARSTIVANEPLTERLRHDALASVVVFLVALPLCLGIAVASGAPPTAGLITGIVGGIIVGALGGSPLQVSGPAAGLSVIVLERVNHLTELHGPTEALAHLGVIVALAGLIQLLAAAMRFGQWFRAVSPAVIHGMLAGIGVLIFAGQFHVMLHHKPLSSGIANLASIPAAIRDGVLPLDGSLHHHAAGVGLITISVLLVWQFVARGPLKMLPPALLGLIAATLFAWATGLTIDRVEVPAGFFQSLQTPPRTLIFAGLASRDTWLSALAIAVVASAETLLCAGAVDKMHTGPRTRYDRELAAQGLGNTICGLLCGLPMTGVIVRSAANVNAGARTRLSAILHGFWLLAAVLILAKLLSAVPQAALAAILVYTGAKLVNIRHLVELWKISRGEAAIFVITLVMIVTTDMLTGVAVGFGLSLAKLLYTFTHLRIDVRTSANRQRTDLYLVGAATFVRLPALAAELERVPPNTELHVHIDRLGYVDHACLDLFLNWEGQHEATGGRLVIDWANFAARFHSSGSQPAGGPEISSPSAQPAP